VHAYQSVHPRGGHYIGNIVAGLPYSRTDREPREELSNQFLERIFEFYRCSQLPAPSLPFLIITLPCLSSPAKKTGLPYLASQRARLRKGRAVENT
jgi:hypothetical protein